MPDVEKHKIGKTLVDGTPYDLVLEVNRDKRLMEKHGPIVHASVIYNGILFYVGKDQGFHAEEALAESAYEHAIELHEKYKKGDTKKTDILDPSLWK